MKHLARTPLFEAIPTDDWVRTWAAGRTIMMRRTSKRVKEQVDKMCLTAVVRLSTGIYSWESLRNNTNELIIFELIAMVSTCRLTTVVLDFGGRGKTY
jgi:hypothetical protein